MVALCNRADHYIFALWFLSSFTILWGHVEEILLLNKFFFSTVDMCLSCEDIAQWSCAMVPRWRFLASFLRPVFSASRAQHVSLAATLRGSRPGVQSASSWWHHWWRHNSETITDRENRDYLGPWNPLSYPMVNVALRQLLQNRKWRHLWRHNLGSRWKLQKKWLERILVFVRSTI